MASKVEGFVNATNHDKIKELKANQYKVAAIVPGRNSETLALMTREFAKPEQAEAAAANESEMVVTASDTSSGLNSSTWNDVVTGFNLANLSEQEKAIVQSI